MANITDNRVIVWSDTRARTMADRLVCDLIKLQTYQVDYAAQGIGALITTGGGTNLVGDTSVTLVDGRRQVLGNDIGANFIAAVNQLVTAWNVTLVTGTGLTVSALMNLVQVNGSMR